MTEPTNPFFTPDLAAQYQKVLGAHPIFTTRPNIAAALAQANPDQGTTQAGMAVPQAHGFWGHVAAIGGSAAHLAANITDAPGIHQVVEGLNTAADATRGAVRVSEY